MSELGLLATPDVEAFRAYFLRELHWEAPNHRPITYTTPDGHELAADNVASVHGVRVWFCAQRPSAEIETKVDAEISKTTTERLVIFADAESQVWRWPSRSTRDGTVHIRPARHLRRLGVEDEAFEAKIATLRLPKDGSWGPHDVVAAIRSAFDTETTRETRRASKLMSRMYLALEAHYDQDADPHRRDHEISVILGRILFLLFGDDTGMWRADQFQDYVRDQTARDGSDIASSINELFRVLDQPENERPAGLVPDLCAFPYVNGGIFHEPIILATGANDSLRTAILDACAVDWSRISPAIFGSMFQSVRDADTRRAMGEHYTSEENILRTLNPLFLDDLREGLVEALARDTAKKRANALHALWDRLGAIQFIDPACGCGNFIIVAYRELREMELQIMLALREIGGDEQMLLDATSGLRVQLGNFCGIELDEWPARLAETAMFLINRQCDQRLIDEFGQAPKRLPITEAAKIVVASALRIDWADVLAPSSDVIVAGNPPYGGISVRSGEQTAELSAVWGDGYHGTLDYVTGWHAKALEYFSLNNGRWAFVTTNSITQGEAVAPLFSAIWRAGWHIAFAYRSFRWTSNAPGQAAVHCVIIGFSRDPSRRRLFECHTPASPPIERDDVGNINPYLVDGPDLVVQPRAYPLNPLLPEVRYGNKPTDGGHFILDTVEADAARHDPVAARFVRPYIGAKELVEDTARWCLWLVDATQDEIAASPLLMTHVARVQEFRMASRASSTRASAATPQLFRQIAQPTTRYLCIPIHVSESRPYFTATLFDADVIASNANFVSDDPHGLAFALISSSMFMTWQRTVGGRLKSDLRFNKLLVWNTFPVPRLGRRERTEIIEAGQGVMQARDERSERSLADHYCMPLEPALQAAHHRLDETVDQVFGATGRIETQADRQAVLFERYLELIGAAPNE